MNDTTTAVQQTTSQSLTIRQELEGSRFRAAVEKVLPKHLTPDRFVRVACLAIMRSPKLAQCDRTSFFNSLMTLSQYGLEPDGRNAHLIPFENRKRGVIECQLIIDYKGIIDLVMRTGEVSRIHADVVCENDEFEYNLGKIEKHRINFRKERGPVYAVYAMVFPKEGGEPKCDVMTKQEVEVVRLRSRASQNGPWVTDWNEMAKKTIFRRLSKWLRLSPEIVDAMDAGETQLNEDAETHKPIIDVASIQTPTGEQGLEPVSSAPVRRVRKPKLDPVPQQPTPEPEDNVPMGDTPPTVDVQSTPVTEATQSVPDEELPDLDQPFGWLIDQMKAEGISEAQMWAWCVSKKLTKPNQFELGHLSTGKLRDIATTWKTVLPEIKNIKI